MISLILAEQELGHRRWTPGRKNKRYAYKVIFNGLISVAVNYNRRKINSAIYHHRVMMHGIAQLAIFSNYLFRLSFGILVYYFFCTRTNNMRMRVYHILPCDKAKQQHPRVDNMVFVFFQVSSAILALNGKSRKKLLKKLTNCNLIAFVFTFAIKLLHKCLKGGASPIFRDHPKKLFSSPFFSFLTPDFRLLTLISRL